MLANNFSTSTCFAIFELIKIMCFVSTLSYPHKEFLNPCPPGTRSRPAASSTRTHGSAGSRTRPASAGTCNPRGLSRSAQDSSVCSLAKLRNVFYNLKSFRKHKNHQMWVFPIFQTSLGSMQP